jgi:hypothetical protein
MANLLPGLLWFPRRSEQPRSGGRALLPEAAVCDQSCRHRRAGTSIVAEAIGRSLTRRSFGESRQRERGLF